MLGNYSCLKMAFAGHDFLEDEIDIDENDVKTMQAVFRGALLRHQLQQVRKEYGEIFREIEGNDRLEIKWPTKSPCCPRIVKKRKQRKADEEKVTSEAVQTDLSRETDLKLPDQEFIPNSCDIETQTSFIEINERKQSNSIDNTDKIFPDLKYSNKVQSKIDNESSPGNEQYISHKLTEIQRGNHESGTCVLTPVDAKQLDIPSRHITEQPEHDINSGVLQRSEQDTRHGQLCDEKDTRYSQEEPESEMGEVTMEMNEQSLLNNINTKTNIEELEKYEVNMQSFDESTHQQKQHKHFDSENRKLSHDPKQHVSMETQKKEDSVLTNVTMTSSLWDSFHSPSVSQQFTKSKEKYPTDPEALMSMRKNTAMELLWVEQAISSRKNYLRLKTQMKIPVTQS